jgi:tetratricopeptide (TPR) repeat protein
VFASALFAVHPVVVEPVVWIPGREELLMTLGALGCVHFHIAARRQSEAKRARAAWLSHGAAIYCCAMACMSNAVAAIIPAIVVAWDFLTLPDRKLPRIVTGTAALWLVSIATIVTKKLGQPPFVATVAQQTFGGRLMIGLNAYWLNLKTLVWPANLSLHYDWLDPQSFLEAGVLLGMIAVLATIGILWLMRRQTIVAFGLLWFGLALAPASQVISHHIHRADRFLYLPLAGLVVAIGAALRMAAVRFRLRAVPASWICLGMIVLLALGVRSGFQVRTWRTNRSTWEHCLYVTPGNARAHDCIADMLVREGRFEQAIPHYEKALASRPNAIETLDFYAGQLATQPELGDPARAVELATRACELTGWRLSDMRKTLSVAYQSLGAELQQKDEYAEAQKNYENALNVDPNNAEAALNLAFLLSSCPDENIRRPQDAVRFAEWGHRVADPTDLNALLILAVVYANSGRFHSALLATEEAYDLATRRGDAKLAADLERQRELYLELTRQVIER